MKIDKPHITLLGEKVISLDWQVGIHPTFHNQLIIIRDQIEALLKPAIKESVLTYQSIMLFLHEDRSKNHVLKTLQEFNYEQTKRTSTKQQKWRIPVVYGQEFGPDLKSVALQNSMSKEEVVQQHSLVNYRVYFTGFMPGFLYLGGLPESIHTPRKKRPDFHVAAGSVAIGGKQTGIYPRESPGGWHVIGRTPIPMFRIDQSPPSPFKPGDSLQFYAVDLIEFNAIEQAFLDDLYDINNFLYD